jgi:hypothetical protein
MVEHVEAYPLIFSYCAAKLTAFEAVGYYDKISILQSNKSYGGYSLKFIHV